MESSGEQPAPPDGLLIEVNNTTDHDDFCTGLTTHGRCYNEVGNHPGLSWDWGLIGLLRGQLSTVPEF